MNRIATACLALLLVVAACGDDDAATTTTVAPATTTTVAPTTLPPDTTTTLVETTTTTEAATTTTTLLALPLIDTFDGASPAVAGLPVPDAMTIDTSVPGVLTIGTPAVDPSPGSGSSYFVLYPVLFRDGVVTMRFQPGATPAVGYSLFMWASDDLSEYTEVMVAGDMVSVVGIAPGMPANQTILPGVAGTFDPVGFNELRVEGFDGTVRVFLNGVSLGEVIDPAPRHEGMVGAALVAMGGGATMTLDEFTIQPEMP